jgi:carbon monoxide dehydrogenase subunit G
MQITKEFTVPLPPDQAWPVLTDLERVAVCIPGASITGVDGDDFEGKAKIKVGPITAEYKGTARFTACDESTHRATVRATGKDARGQGNVAADVGLQLEPFEGGSRVLVNTELDISGKIAQFGRGVIDDAASALLAVFAQQLSELMLGDDNLEDADSPADTVAPAGQGAVKTAGPRRPQQQSEDTLDVLKLARGMRSSGSAPAVATQTAWLPALVAVFAAIVSVFAAGYTAGKSSR